MVIWRKGRAERRLLNLIRVCEQPHCRGQMDGGLVRKWAEEVEEAGVGHMFETFDPERKEEMWTVTRRISWTKRKNLLLLRK